jgi:drug/metabolite transporter (DMT)-like permease
MVFARSSSRTADLMLLAVTVCWGVSFAAIKTATHYASPALFVAVRFTAATLLLLALWPWLLRGEPTAVRRRGYRILGDPPTLRWGLLMGTLIAAGYTTQTVGLTTTSADNSAFLTALSVVLVPVLVFLVHGEKPGRPVMAGLGLALLGLALLTRPDLGRTTTGDLWTLGTAAAYAVYLERLSAALKRVPYLPLLFWTVAVCAAWNVLLAATVETRVWHWHAQLAAALAVTTLLSTLLALYLQNRFQGRTTATRAALIFSAEPVFAAAFAWALLGERLTGWSLAGAALILGAVTLTELRDAAAFTTTEARP